MVTGRETGPFKSSAAAGDTGSSGFAGGAKARLVIVLVESFLQDLAGCDGDVAKLEELLPPLAHQAPKGNQMPIAKPNTFSTTINGINGTGGKVAPLPPERFR